MKYLPPKWSNRIIGMIVVTCLAWEAGPVTTHGQSHPYQDKPLTNPDPSNEAKALFRYLQDMDGKKILSGQMWAPWGISEINYLLGVTGRLPALAGFDFIHESDNPAEVIRARSYWEAGGIPTIMWHWGAPGVGEGYENSKVKIDITRCFQQGTRENLSMWTELERKANHLETLRDAGIPVLWRPFHELSGGWFWWGMQGPDLFKQLWVTMYNYFVHERGLNNLIWVLCYPGDPDAEWYPGDEYVDMAGADTYGVGSNPQSRMYEAVKEIVAHNPMPIPYHECGTPPDPDRCIEEGSMWSWWMQWHTSHLTDTDQEYLRYVYNHELVVTRDELPDIVAVYGWDSTCTADSILMRVQIDEGGWLETSELQVHLEKEALISPVTENPGTWTWTGCGISGDGSEQLIGLDQRCVATATFTNQCGATSTASFFITGVCSSTSIRPYIVLPDNLWLDTTWVSVEPGTTVEFVPQPSTGGSWIWSGPDMQDSSRRVTLVPYEDVTYTVTHINDCGAVSTIDFQIAMADHTGIPSAAGGGEILIYPTIIRDRLHIAFPSAVRPGAVIEIYSPHGSMLFYHRAVGSSLDLDLSSLGPGNYLVRIRDGHRVKRAWVVKPRP